MSDFNWNDLHKNYARQDWIGKPSLFAETVLSNLPEKAKILELGAGHGQDSSFFVRKGHETVVTDIETAALEKTIAALPKESQEHIVAQAVDLTKPLPFADNSFDVIYAHLSLHYFDNSTTIKLFDELYRVLRSGGIIAFFANSTTDPEYGAGTQLEPDFFQIDKVTKRYFSVDSAKKYAKKFQIILADNQGETYKDSAKGVHNLIRFIGRKP